MPIAPAIPTTNTVVTITVHPPVSGGRYALSHFPRRTGDTQIFHAAPGHSLPAGKARQVKWEVDGLSPDQCVEIKEKTGSGAKGRIGPDFSIVHPTKQQLSGRARPRTQASRLKQETWSYEIVLRESKGGPVLARIDPEIIINEYP